MRLTDIQKQIDLLQQGEKLTISYKRNEYNIIKSLYDIDTPIHIVNKTTNSIVYFFKNSNEVIRLITINFIH